MTERYPSAVELRQIRNWNNDYEAMMKWIESLWAYRDFGWRKKGHTYYVSTAGWSGNEEIIQAMKEAKNWFWNQCWYQSTQGGHYVFKVKNYLVEKKNQ